jgi:hypothetical protein
MTPIQKSLLLASALIVIALLAVFDIIPQEVAQYAPLAVVPFVLSQGRNGRCRPGAAS